MRIALVISVLSSVALGSTSCGRTCNLLDEAKQRAGSSAVDCGQVATGMDRALVDSCVIAAFQNAHGFFAQYDLQGIDSNVVLGIVGTSEGKVFSLFFDSDPSGGGGADPAISGMECEAPRVETSLASRPPNTSPFDCGSLVQLGYVCK